MQGMTILHYTQRSSHFMLREKQFYKTFSVLALSLALHNLLSYSVNMMDMVMPG